MVIESYLQHDKSTEWSKFFQARFQHPLFTFPYYLENPASIIARSSLPPPFSFQTL